MLLVLKSLGYYHHHKKERKKKKVRPFPSARRISRAGRRRRLAGGLVRAAPDLEKVTVIHDPVRYSVAGAWTVAIVPFRFVTPRPRACAKVQKSLRGPERACAIFGGSRPTATGPACTASFFSHFRPQTA